MLIGYARISKADGSQSLDLQRTLLGFDLIALNFEKVRFTRFKP